MMHWRRTVLIFSMLPSYVDLKPDVGAADSCNPVEESPLCVWSYSFPNMSELPPLAASNRRASKKEGASKEECKKYFKAEAVRDIQRYLHETEPLLYQCSDSAFNTTENLALPIASTNLTECSVWPASIIACLGFFKSTALDNTSAMFAECIVVLEESIECRWLGSSRRVSSGRGLRKEAVNCCFLFNIGHLWLSQWGAEKPRLSQS